MAADDQYTVVHDRQLRVDAANGLLANDGDPDGDDIQVRVVTPPAHGSLETQETIGGGGFSYVPNGGYVGKDTFTYKVWDGLADSGTATVTISGASSAPVAAGEPAFQTGAEDAPLSGSVLGNDSDADGDPLQAVLQSGPSSGDLVFRDDGTFTYTPPVNFGGQDYFTYAVTDGVDTSSPVTVDLQYGLQPLIDIDGKDTGSSGQWMHEDDQQEYGLGVRLGSPAASVTLRTGDYQYWYPGYEVVQRSVVWDASAVAVNGSKAGQIQVSTTGDDEVLDVTALRAGFEEAYVSYYIILENPETGDVVDGGNSIRVVERKGVLDQVEFTTDHDLIRENTRNVMTGGARYKNVEFVRRTKYNAPITHTWNSKIELDVTFSTAGINAGDQIRVVGASNEPALRFDSGVFAAAAAGQTTKHLTATNALPVNITKIDASIDWWLQAFDAGANQWKNIFLGTSGSHKVYVTAGTPRNHLGTAAMDVTDLRMDRVVDVGGKAMTNARAKAGVQSPSYARVVYEILRQHKFNLNVSVFGPKFAEDGWAGVWKVYDTWSATPPGSDCVSGAAFTVFVGYMAGLPGTMNHRSLAAKSDANPGTAIDYVNDATRWKLSNPDAAGRQYWYNLQHMTTGSPALPDGAPNNFEAAVVYTNAGSTFYYPSGIDEAGGVPAANAEVAYDDADKVLYVFDRLAWYFKSGAAVTTHTIFAYQPKPATVNID